jgi:phage shock protein PspC (stress-responsive transcriptional regulator)
MRNKRLYRTEDGQKMVAGVCGGIAEYFELDPTLIRIGWVIATCMGTLGLWPYLICAIIMPRKSTIYPDL